jgi:hypothetical protein
VRVVPVANSDKFRDRIAVLRLTPIGVVVMVMVCAGKLGRRMIARGMFARGVFGGHRMVGMRAVRACRAMIRQSGAVALHRSAARAGCRGVTAQSATRAVATSASTHMSAAATTTTAGVAASATTTTAGVAAAAARGDAR